MMENLKTPRSNKEVHVYLIQKYVKSQHTKVVCVNTVVACVNTKVTRVCEYLSCFSTYRKFRKIDEKFSNT